MITITITSRRPLDQADRQRMMDWFEKRLDLGLAFAFQADAIPGIQVDGLPRKGK